jgi:hypothetical protein
VIELAAPGQILMAASGQVPMTANTCPKRLPSGLQQRPETYFVFYRFSRKCTGEAARVE